MRKQRWLSVFLADPVGAFIKFRQATISVVMSVCPSTVIIILNIEANFLPNKLTYQPYKLKKLQFLEDGQELRPKHIGAIINEIIM
jgi:hypothetical protein